VKYKKRQENGAIICPTMTNVRAMGFRFIPPSEPRNLDSKREPKNRDQSLGAVQ
jgi:hypothetical protein